MPSSLTSKIYDGQEMSGREFLLRCAREFGALIHMREEPLDAPLTYPTVSDHHLNEIEKAKERLAQAEQMTLEEFESERDKMLQDLMERNEKQRVEKQVLRNRYEAILMEVQAWQSPTPDHEELKAMAIRQLQDSMNADCSFFDYEPRVVPVEEYRQNRIDSAKQNIQYHEKKYQKEQEMVARKIEWIKGVQGTF